jgi:hypothetical protein
MTSEKGQIGDELDELFVCQHCRKPLGADLERVRAIKAEVFAAKMSAEDALDHLSKVVQLSKRDQHGKN